MNASFFIFACAACYGTSDSPMALGLNWGIFSLLAVVVFVLGGIAGFFIYLIKKAGTATVAAAAAPGIVSSVAEEPAPAHH